MQRLWLFLLLYAAFGHAQTFSVIYNFQYDGDGSLALSRGMLYGSTIDGHIFQLSTSGQYSPITYIAGAQVYSGVVRDSVGNLYGVNTYGGTKRRGSIFKVDPSGNVSTLWSFGTTGKYPTAGLLLHNKSLFGTVGQVIFRLDAQGKLHRLFVLNGDDQGSGSMNNPFIIDKLSNLYNTTPDGGDPNCFCGVVYKFNMKTKVQTILHVFVGSYYEDNGDGAYPFTGLVMDTSGNLYGTTSSGGANNRGTVFKIDPQGNYSILYSFMGGPDGDKPEGGLTLDKHGNLWGTTTGLDSSEEFGTVFEVNSVTGAETVIHNFTVQDGGYPESSLVMDAAGNFYGTTTEGGVDGGGTVFKVSAK